MPGDAFFVPGFDPVDEVSPVFAGERTGAGIGKFGKLAEYPPDRGQVFSTPAGSSRSCQWSWTMLIQTRE
jgi:hypothetical protein